MNIDPTLFSLGVMSVTNSINSTRYNTNSITHPTQSPSAAEIARELHNIQREEEIKQLERNNRIKTEELYSTYPFLRELDNRPKMIEQGIDKIKQLFQNGAKIFCYKYCTDVIIPFQLADEHVQEAYISIFDDKTIHYIPVIAFERWLQHLGANCRREKINHNIYIRTSYISIHNFIVLEDKAMTFSLNEEQIVILRNYLSSTNHKDIVKAMTKAKGV
jgi:hypothetical protein